MTISKKLNRINDEVKESLHQTLAICQNAGESYNSEMHSYLENTLGMTGCATTKVLVEQKKALEIVGIKREVISEFATIQKNLGEKAILDFAGLVNLCKEHNLYFGAAPLFIGQITPNAIEETKLFDFNKAKNLLYVGERKSGTSVIEWLFRPIYGYTLVVVAPITMFNLGTEGKKVVICNHEIIEHEYGTSHRAKKDCGDKDPVLLLPFQSRDRKVYFIVITNWES